MTISILDRLDEHARLRPEEPACFHKHGAAWHPTSWTDFRAQVRRTARAFIALGLEPEDTVGILGFNRLEWTVSGLAAMAAGGVIAGIYTTNAAPQVAYVLEHAASKVAVVENGAQWEKVRQMRDQLPHLRRVVIMDSREVPEDPLVISWQALAEQAAAVSEDDLDSRCRGLASDRLASLIYTSGTTGPPKGVMLSHGNLLRTAAICAGLLDSTPRDRALSYLPLAHIAEQMLSIYLPVYAGYAVSYAESLERLMDNLKEVRPTVIFGVPRVWERIHAGLTERLGQTSGLKGRLARWAMDVGRRTASLRNAGGRPEGSLALAEKLADRLVLAKIRHALGMDRIRLCASGAAPIALEVLEFFAGLRLIIHEVYGQSEGSGPTTWNRPGRTRFGTVGPVIPEIEVRLGEDDEILVRGPNVFLGYFKDPRATAETLEEGWLHSGDLGAFDADGFLTIIGRKKEILITSGGKNISPNAIETALKGLDLVGEAVLVGEGRKYLTVLLTLDPDRGAELCQELGIEAAELPRHPEALRRLRQGVDSVNQSLSRVEQIKKLRVLPEPLSIDAGELTPTLKVRRTAVYERHTGLIEEMYEEG